MSGFFKVWDADRCMWASFTKMCWKSACRVADQQERTTGRTHTVLAA